MNIGDRFLRIGEPVEPGDRLTVTLTAENGYWRTPSGGAVRRVDGPASHDMRRAGTVVRPRPNITFEPGDVVVLRFLPWDSEFTYVRGASRFVGEKDGGVSDESVADLFRAGRGRLIARKGCPVSQVIDGTNFHVLGTTDIPF